jgi:hypothetical protein
VQAKSGNGLVVTTSRNRSIVVLRVDRRVNELTKLGAPVAELDAYLKNQPKPQARLAAGVDSHNSPHSAKAVADNRKPAAKAEAKAATQGQGTRQGHEPQLHARHPQGRVQARHVPPLHAQHHHEA